MNVAVIGTSRKENERRVAIHPAQVAEIPKKVRRRLFFERGYGMPFGVPDGALSDLTGNRPADRAELLRGADAVILPKPVEQDLMEVREGAAVWGWVHSVQQEEIAQIAIDRRLTLVAWENMFYRGKRDRVHVFQKNNEMAGYCGVQQALELRGMDGYFGRPLRAAVLGFGSVSRGAVLALRGHGVQDITVLTRRPTHLVANRIPGLRYRHIRGESRGGFSVESPGGAAVPLVDFLTGMDIAVNGVLQNPERPLVFIRNGDVARFRKECLVVDVSCDEKMGFQFARPADFDHPLQRVGNLLYYSVDHTPSLLWDSASWEISSALLPYLPDFVLEKPNRVLEDAVDIREGIVRNKAVLTFQNRSPIYPYPVRKEFPGGWHGAGGSGGAPYAAGAAPATESSAN